MTTTSETLKVEVDSKIVLDGAQTESESSPLAYLVERRRFSRVRLSTPLPAQLGRTRGVVVDLNTRGACVRHTNAVPRGGTVRLTLNWGARQCSATALVISSRIVSLGSGPSPLPVFKSRLKLVEVP